MQLDKPDWQQQLTNSLTKLPELLAHLELDYQSLNLDPLAVQTFGLRVPHAFLSRIKPKDPLDPLLLQVLPQRAEADSVSGFLTDPVGEIVAGKTKGLLHKYQGRVLLILTGGCAINCRYCFRRHFPYQANAFSLKHAAKIIDYIKKDPSIYEVILSGGDPLIVKDEQLAALISQLETIPHLKYLRIHTRVPIMIPARITDALVQMLKHSRLQTSIAIHCNHANEIDQSVADALDKLKSQKINLFNQTVLLKSINDSADTLIELSHKLFSVGVIPYYLHLLDPVAGAAHFDIAEEKAKEIMRELQRSLPGYLVPKLVREIAGEPNKIQIL